MQRLQKLSEELNPLESPYADVRFFDVDVEQTQQHYDVNARLLLTLFNFLLIAGHSHGGRCGNCRRGRFATVFRTIVDGVASSARPSASRPSDRRRQRAAVVV
jgi:hypothetical protein